MQTPNELGLDYPSWRESQEKAVEWLEQEEWLKGGGGVRGRVRVLEAPTGSGKTGIVLALAMRNEDKRFLILCATKVEQEQYLKNLIYEDDIASVRGKNNFHCSYKHPELEEDKENYRGERGERGERLSSSCSEYMCPYTHVNEAPCSSGFKCEVKNRGGCEYFNQLEKAQSSRVVLTNYAYGLSMMNYVPKGGLGKFDVIIEDEGHVLDEELEKFLLIRLSRRVVVRAFGVRMPFGEHDLVFWKDWVERYWDVLSEAGRRYHGVKKGEMNKDEVKDFMDVDRYLSWFKKITTLDDNWVVESDERSVSIQPIWVTDDSKDILFDKSSNHIIMSGTIPSPSELGAKVGLGVKDFEFYRLPYTFPVENRPIILKPEVSLKFQNVDVNLPKVVELVDREIEKALGKKVLIHTKTYKISKYLAENSEWREYFYTHTTATRNNVLEEFKEASPPAVLCSPSFDKAIDLPGKQCELVVIVKVPYPYLGSKVMQARSKNRRYYLHETLMTIIQMAGRGVRSETDVCPTVILDDLGPKFFQQVRKMLPSGIKDAVEIQERRGVLRST